jgi:hypothetical protein
MKKYNSRIYNPIILVTTAIFGILSITVTAWAIIGVIMCTVVFIYVQNRADNIDHYCVGVDLDTNRQGDVIEIFVYAFNKTKNYYYPITTHFKQLRIYVNVVYLDNFYANIGYPIVEDLEFLIRKVVGSKTQDIKTAKLFYRTMIRNLNQGYKYSAGSLREKNIEQPRFNNTKTGLGGRLWNWWTFKTNN